MLQLSEEQRHKTMIAEACKRFDISPGEEEWEMDSEDGRMTARLGNWRVITEDEDLGLYEGDEGELSATVVGAERFHNEQVRFYFCADGQDSGESVIPFDDVEPV